MTNVLTRLFHEDFQIYKIPQSIRMCVLVQIFNTMRAMHTV